MELKDSLSGKENILQTVKFLILQKIVLRDCNHLGATRFLTFCDPCLGRDPYFKNHCPIGRLKFRSLAQCSRHVFNQYPDKESKDDHIVKINGDTAEHFCWMNVTYEYYWALPDKR